MTFLYALGLLGVVVAMSTEVQRQQNAARRRLLGRARARALDEGQRCPYCLDGLQEDEDDDGARIRCPDCGTRHHLECWREHGSCSVHGCGRTHAVTADDPVAKPVSVDEPVSLDEPVEPVEPVETVAAGAPGEAYALDPRG